MLDQSIEETIEAGMYDLTDVLDLIDLAYAEGRLTRLGRDALAEHARANARPENSYAPVGDRVTAIESAVRDLAARVAALEASDADKPDAPTDEWPEWVQPTGAMDVYAKGDRVTFNGRRWVSLMDGNAWSPAAYPQGWEEYKDAKEED